MLTNITSSLYGQLIVAALLGAIQVFAFAPFQQWWVLYPSFVGLFLLLKQAKLHHKKLFLVSFVFNLSMFVATLHWIYVSMDLFGGMPFIASALLIVLLCAYLAIFPSLALWLSYRIPTQSDMIRLLLILPSFWLIMDWVRGWFLTGFPWAYLGYSHADTPLVGFAPILGVQGITLAIMLICACLTLILLKQSQKFASLLILSIVMSGYSLKQLSFTELQAPIKVALVQGNIDQNQKWEPDQLYPSILKYLGLSGIKNDVASTETAEQNEDSKQQAELIIWPESAIAALEIDMQRFLQSLSRKLEEENKTLLTGIINYDINKDEYFNSIIMLGQLPSNQGYSQTSPNRYSKHQLLPIGEFVPFESLLRPLAPYFNLPMSSFQRGGAHQANLKFADTTLAAALCYEIAFPELLRENIHEKTGLILTLSNDAWFGHSIGPAQHLEIARMRAIELGRPLLRSTNNGITAIFDSKGQEIERLPSNVDAVLRQEVQPAYGFTPYQRVGQTPLFMLCLLALLSALYLIKRP
ncbi:apolipoprotein N-acyltransferase [Psychromonas sp. 14N.309.X.WAT.B.A12]|uniref:apolipoprotein N-acyltransferase n=1 Tax=unclassified Psychromonas TaxID=2614957 RepID=UPI0025B241F5|nr:apolipoprotein N-acyltransferase [Psychromonas sp. 14N.309.X.WAT.B.A12]MDN2662956.1 apolipoprotein N-acyltransferase [Psychromonas sp. 14N.309.X.WAT.B.A12]